MKTIENFKTQAKSQHLQMAGLTDSQDGYPQPELGYFVHGFNSWKELEAFAELTGGSPHFSQWKDGWNYVHSLCDANEYTLGTIESDWYGDDYEVLHAPINEEDFIKMCGFETWDQMKELEDEYFVTEKKKHFEEIQKVIEKVDFDTHCMVLYLNEFEDIQPKNPLTFTHDTRHKALGVAWLWDV